MSTSRSQGVYRTSNVIDEKIGFKMKKYKIIDAHCHIYPDKIAEKASAATCEFYHRRY